jgi:hypothetical protein
LAAGPQSVKEGKVAISFHLHGELTVLVDTVQVIRAVPQPVGSTWPDDESAIHITEPAERLMGSPVEFHLLEILHKELAVTRDNGKPIASPSNFSQNSPTKLIYEVRAWQKSLRISTKCRLSRLMVSLIGTLVKSDTTSKLPIISCGVRSCQYESPVGQPGVLGSDKWVPQWCS